MASNVTRDHHNLRRNLKLNSNYISNDGGDEGISITDAGHVTTGSASVVSAITNTTSANNIALHIDLDSDGSLDSGSQTLNNTGLNLDVTRAITATHASATINNVGIDLDVTSGDTDGDSVCVGIDITTSGADKNFGLKINNPDNNASDGTQADFINYSSANTNNFFYMNTEASGETTFGTLDTGGLDGHINFNPNGRLIIQATGNEYAYFQKVNPYSRFRIYGYGQTTDYLQIDVDLNGAAIISTDDDNAAAAHINIEADGHVEFDNCAVGFDRLEAGWGDTDVIESGGTNDTDIDFRLSNKYRLELQNDIDQINLIFPNTSGNFLLTCHILAGGGGDHDVAAWKVWEHDSVAGSTNPAGTTDVMWAGGSVPAFTSGASTDIVSFYWDADEQQCYGVASLAFATP